MHEQVKIWIEDVCIPTYPVGVPEKNPMFLERRIYQGSSGVVYPHAVIDKIYDEKIDKLYKAVFLENDFIKIMVLPELGGRIQMAYDKIKQRHFIYYNQVIKPALVGLTGPWISGGIEFNWPQHHRPSTFEPVDYTIKENLDGSKTVWLNEVERMFGTKGLMGISLHPLKAFIEIRGKLYNRTQLPQTFLWWANPAVKVNDHYQSVFPPDVHAVFDHGKRDVSSFPIAKGVYYKVDYSPGTDISWYKNIPVPTSYMAIISKYNFIGGYEHDTHGGLLHVADHHISPGKKQWTWGYGEFGQAWDRNLTDEDGPYIELMTGIFTDNQPDFSWLQPYEEKTFVQYFMPYSEVGIVKNATKEAMVGIEYNLTSIDVKLYVTGIYDKIKIALFNQQVEFYNEEISCSPNAPWSKNIQIPLNIAAEDILLEIIEVSTNKILVSYRQEKKNEQQFPLAAQAAKRPRDVETNEQLYLTGLHLEQYRHATYMARDYYEEALRRDAGDSRNNNALGLWYLRKGRFEKAEFYLKTAIATLTQRNPNPYDGEPWYNLGCCLKMQGKIDEAFEAFYKSVWNDAWQHAAYLNLARISCMKENYEEALDFINKSLVKNYNSYTAWHLKVIALRKCGKEPEAYLLIADSLAIDPFNFSCLFEKYLILTNRSDLHAATETLEKLKELSRNWEHNFIAYAWDYAEAGMYDEAIQLLQVLDNEKPYPMIYYYLGWFSYQQGLTEQAFKYYQQAADLSPDFCFPNRIEDVPVLQNVLQFNKDDYKAFYYLGNLWYDKRQYDEAIQCWEQSIKIYDGFPTCHRNLALAYYNKRNEVQKALISLETAFRLNTKDARVLMELDQLYKKLNKPHAERLAFLDEHAELVEFRDDLYLEKVTLHNQLKQFETAKQLIESRLFHPWEGGEGKVVKQYLISHIELAKIGIENKNQPEKALQLLFDAEHYPHNLGEGKLYGDTENDIHYLKGVVYELQGNFALANECFINATKGDADPVAAIFYNDPQPDKIFYQGLAWLKLNQKERAVNVFNKLVDFGLQNINNEVSIDYFAVSLPDLLVFEDDLNLRNKIHCLYMAGLGCLGLGGQNSDKANQYFDEVLALDINHQGASIHKTSK